MFRLTTRVAIFQTAILIATASVAWVCWGERAALSSAYGVAVALMTTLLSVLRERESAANEAWTAQRYLRQMFRLELERLVLAGALLAAGFASGKLEALALISGFMLAQSGWLAVIQKQNNKKQNK